MNFKSLLNKGFLSALLAIYFVLEFLRFQVLFDALFQRVKLNIAPDIVYRK